jgi:dynactin complex subunit
MGCITSELYHLQVIFEENSRLEEILSEQKAEMDRLSTENKELHLKMDIILEENRRLKAILNASGQQQQQQHHQEEQQQYAGQPQQQQPVFLKRCAAQISQ